tara:strand:+ start:286 stop:4545 length:4260 start_codon:yes stop_codon:yes gene_type:complete
MNAVVQAARRYADKTSSRTLTTGRDPITFIDGDSVNSKGVLYRIQGFDTPEINRIINGGEFKEGTPGGRFSFDVLTGLANKYGFDNVVPQLDENGDPVKDMGGEGNRVLADLINDKGESWTNFVLSNGLESPDAFATDEQIGKYTISSLQRERERLEGRYQPDELDAARDAIDMMKEAEGYKQFGFKREALNERELQTMNRMGLGGYFQQDSVQLRSPDRYMDNRAKNYISDTFEKTLIGMKEAGYGVMSMVGDTAGSEWLSNVGEQGVERSRRSLLPYAETLHSFRDIESFSDSFEYVTNALAMSIPYIATTMGAMALAGPTMGASFLAPVSLYSGQTYNEMDADNKNVGLAALSGALQTVLDVAGARFIIRPGAATKDVLQKAVDTLVASGLTQAAAKQRVQSASRKVLADLAGDAVKVASSQIASKQAFVRLLKRGALNTSVEGATEAMQEATAYIAAHNKSVIDGTFDWEKFYMRTSEALVAGGVLGAGFTIPGAAYNAGAWADVKYGVLPSKAKNESTGDRLAQLEAELHNKDNRDLPTNSEVANELKQSWRDGQQRQARGASDANKVHTPDGKVTPITLTEDKQLPDFQWRVDQHQKVKKDRSTFESIVNAVSKPMALVVGSNHAVHSDAVLNAYRSARKSFSMLGGNRWQIFPGQDFISMQQLNTAAYKAMVPDAGVFYAMFNPQRKRLSKKLQSEIGKDFYDIVSNAIDPITGVFNKSRIGITGDNVHKVFKDLNPEQRQSLKSFIVSQVHQMEDMAQAMYTDQTQPGLNPDLKQTVHYLLKSKKVDKYKVRQKADKFLEKLQNVLGMTRAEAQDTLDTFMDNPEISEIGEAFSVTKGGILPGSHHERKYGISERPEFQEFLELDVYENLSHHAKQAARYVAHQTFLGNNAEVLSQAMNEMEAEGAPVEIVNEIAHGLNDIYNASSGNYKRPTTAAGKQAVKLQKNLLSLAMFASLPLSTISSLPELGMTTMGLTSNQIFGKKGEARRPRYVKQEIPDPADPDKTITQASALPFTPGGSLRQIGSEFASMLWSGMDEVVNLTVQREGNIKTADGRTKMVSPGMTLLKDLGFMEWKVGAATVTGVTEVNHAHQFFYQSFFKWIGLTGWTDFMRAARAGSAGDFIYNHMETIRKSRVAGDIEKPNAVAQAERELRAVGLRVDGTNNIIDRYFDAMYGTLGVQYKADGTTVADQNLVHANALDQIGKEVKTAYYHFVNQSVPLPNAANRPIFYSNPHYALFLQFNGFISAFTANQIPRLWMQYVKRGTPAMKYNAFAAMTTMIVMGFASQYLKDLIKYGGRTPYLDDAEYLQRGVRSSGLMGSLERAYDQVSPLYAQRSSNKAEWLVDTAVGESPALGYVARGFKAAGKVAEGDVSGGTRIGFKLLPGIGPLNQVGNAASNQAKAWDFNNEEGE